MKRLINSQAIVIHTFILFYLLGAFYSCSFDISKWTNEARFAVALFGAFSVLITKLIYFYSTSDYNND